MTAINTAYASNSATPLLTIEFLHSSLTGGALRLVQAYYDLEATLEDSSTVTFTASGIGISLPEKSTEGRQDLNIQIDNASNLVWQQVKLVIDANRTSQEKIICKFRSFLEADLSAPAGAVYVLTVTGTTINRNTAGIQATYTPIPDTGYPRKRYYPTSYPGVKY